MRRVITIIGERISVLLESFTDSGRRVKENFQVLMKRTKAVLVFVPFTSMHLFVSIALILTFPFLNDLMFTDFLYHINKYSACFFIYLILHKKKGEKEVNS